MVKRPSAPALSFPEECGGGLGRPLQHMVNEFEAVPQALPIDRTAQADPHRLAGFAADHLATRLNDRLQATPTRIAI